MLSLLEVRMLYYVPGGNAKVSFVDVRNIASVAANILIDENW